MDNVGLAAHRSGAACPTRSPTSAPFPEAPSSRRGRPELSYLDNGTAYTSRGFRVRLKELGIAHRRSGYRDPESQAFIESWFSKLKERLVWRSEFHLLCVDLASRRLMPTFGVITLASVGCGHGWQLDATRGRQVGLA